MYLFLSEKCTSSPEPEGVSSAACFLDMPASVLSRLNLTASKSCSPDNGTESCPSSPFGMTSEPSTESPGADLSTQSVQDSPASVILTSGRCTGAMDSTVGRTLVASLEKSDQGQFSWKMSQQSLGGFGGMFSEICPDWGMMHDGDCFRLAPSVTHTHGKGCSYWRTPAASDWKRRNLDWESVRKLGNPLCLPQQIAQRGFHGHLSPAFLADLMDWPTMWASAKPLGMDKFQQWLSSHGRH